MNMKSEYLVEFALNNHPHLTYKSSIDGKIKFLPAVLIELELVKKYVKDVTVHTSILHPIASTSTFTSYPLLTQMLNRANSDSGAYEKTYRDYA